MPQKTWTELLGPYDETCFVLGSQILRNLGDDRYKVLWSFFRDADIAFRCFKAWQAGR